MVKCDITYEKDYYELYDGGRHYANKFMVELVFTGLTVEARKKMSLPTEKINPDYDPNKEDTLENPRMIPLTDKDDTHEMVVSPVAGATLTEQEQKNKVMRDAEKVKSRYMNWLVQKEPVENSVKSDELFK